MSKGRVFLFHWNQSEIEDYASKLRAWGWDVDTEWEDGARGGSAVKQNPPAAVIFDLTHKPSHSRATAEYLAQTKATSGIPLIFVGGEGSALEKTKSRIPNGVFVSQDQLAATLEQFAKA